VLNNTIFPASVLCQAAHFTSLSYHCIVPLLLMVWMFEDGGFFFSQKWQVIYDGDGECKNDG